MEANFWEQTLGGKIGGTNSFGGKFGEQVFGGENSFASKFLGEEIWGAKCFGRNFRNKISFLEEKYTGEQKCFGEEGYGELKFLGAKKIFGWKKIFRRKIWTASFGE